MVHPLKLLRWQYLGRLTLSAGIFAGALLVWPSMASSSTLVVTLAFVCALVFTLGSFAYTHIHGGPVRSGLLYSQVVFDVLLVTAVVHVTGGPESDFAPLYILVIASAAVLLPLQGGVLIGILAGIVYVGDIVWLHAAAPPLTVLIQAGLFAVVAAVTAALGERLRRAGMELGQVEVALRQLRLDHSEILGTLDTGVVTVDADGRLMYMNRAAASLLRLSAREWTGRPALAALDERAPGLGRMLRETAERSRPAWRREVRARDAGGEHQVLGVHTTILNREDAPWVTAIFQDITDSTRVEALRRRAERLEAVAELAASLAHEIKNPLASIRSAVEQLAGGHAGALDHERLERLVSTESDRLSRLLSDFIEFSGVRVTRKESVDAIAEIQGAVELASEHPGATAGAVVDYKAPSNPVRVAGDADLLHRAVFNLVLNALQQSREGGTVNVRLGRVHGRSLPTGVSVPDPVQIVVSDEGPGIPPEDAARLFDPFFTRREGGTGLGLALVHRAVEAHEGAIFVDDVPTGGARFTIYLPGASQAEGAGAGAAAEAGTGHSERAGAAATAVPEEAVDQAAAESEPEPVR